VGDNPVTMHVKLSLGCKFSTRPSKERCFFGKISRTYYLNVFMASLALV